ncbi:MAG: hypothetical protein COB09_18580 [Thalassobium sp.]|nr:MAG: hypothetical protein COB09_18580 [Thalassobium sp.]
MTFKKNTAVTGFPFNMITPLGVDVTTGTPVGYYTLDGGAQTAIADVTPVHEGNGQWTVDLTAAEMNGDLVGLLFTHASSVTASFTIPTEPTNILVDVVAISGDSTAADNLELQYDGTGLIGESFPASQDQLGSLSVGSASIATVASGYLLTTGAQSSNLFTDTETIDGVRHEHTDSAGTLDLYYEFNVTGAGVATDAIVNGYLTGGNDDLTVYAYDWIGASWDVVGEFSGKNGSTNDEFPYILTARNTGAGADKGKVRIRFESATLSSATLRIDRILMGYAVVAQSIGYAGGAIWLDSGVANTNTEVFVDGVADNPVSTIAAATTLSTSVGVKRFRVSRNTTIQLAQAYDSFEFDGIGYIVDLNGQSIESCSFINAILTGVGTSTATLVFLQGRMDNVTLPGLLATLLTINGTFTFVAGTYTFASCGSSFSSTALTLQFGLTTGSTDTYLRGWLGGNLVVENLGANGTDVLNISGFCESLILAASCTGGTLVVSGHVNVIDNSGGAVTILDDSKSFNIGEVARANIELQFDTTGLTGDTFPATQAQANNFSAGSAAVSTTAIPSPNGFVITTGTSEVNTEDSTTQQDGIYHIIEDAGATDVYYIFSVGGNGVPVAVEWIGYLQGNASDWNFFAWNFTSTTWEQVGALIGSNTISVQNHIFSLTTGHVGTGGDLGEVRFRIQSANGSLLATDRILCDYSVVSQSVGYSGGAVWIDTVNGVAGTESFVNGTADNPVLTLADAIIIATNMGLHRFQVSNGSSITFSESHDNEVWTGFNWALALGGQDISDSWFFGPKVSGIATATGKPQFQHCELGTVTLPPCRINGGTGFTAMMTLGSAGEFDLLDCNSLVAGESSPTIDLGAGVGACSLNIRDWSGGLVLLNVEAGDDVSLEGTGGTISVGGTGGDVHIRGIWENVTDVSGAAVNVIQVAALNRKSIAGYEDGSVWLDTNGSNTNTIDYVDGTSENNVSTIAAATTILESLGLKTLTSLRFSSFTLAQAYVGYGFQGGGASIALGGQDVGGAVFVEALLSGVAIGSIQVVFDTCKLTNVTMPPAGVLNSSISGVLTLGAAGKYTLRDCFTSADATPAIVDFGVAIGNTHIEIHHWAGGLELQNLGQSGVDTVNLNGESHELVINANCIGGTVNIAGDMVIVDNSGGAVTINKQGFSTKVQVAALNNFDPTSDQVSADIVQISGNTEAATNLAQSTQGIEIGAAVTGTLSITQMSTNLTETTNDHYKDSLLIFVSGTLAKQSTTITGYNGTTKVLTFDAITEAPLNTDNFVIV